MEIEFDILPEVYSWVVLIFAVYFLLYYKFIYSIIDPLFSWIFATAFSSYFATQVIPNLDDTFHFFGCQLSLWIGFIVAYRQADYFHKVKYTQVYIFSDQLALRCTTYFLLAIYILSNVIVGYNKGFALFSDNPTLSRVEDFQAGFGLFRKINWATGRFAGSALMYMYLLKGRKKDFIFFILVALFSAVDGSKSALFGVITTVGVILFHPAFSDKKLLLKRVQIYTPFLILGALSITFAVLIKEKGGLEEAYLGLIKRLLYNADSLLYFYQPVNVAYFEKYSFIDYIPVITNPILGFLRLQPYQEVVGNIMYDNLRAPDSVLTTTVGPNAAFYIEGRIYFYYWGAFPFSMLLGYLYARIRIHYFLLNSTSAFYFVFMSCVFQIGAALTGDVGLTVSLLFGLAFFVIPPYLLVSFLLNRKFTIRLRPSLRKLSGS